MFPIKFLLAVGLRSWHHIFGLSVPCERATVGWNPGCSEVEYTLDEGCGHVGVSRLQSRPVCGSDVDDRPTEENGYTVQVTTSEEQAVPDFVASGGGTILPTVDGNSIVVDVTARRTKFGRIPFLVSGSHDGNATYR